MVEQQEKLLSKLVVISKIDSVIARIKAEEKKIETTLADQIIAFKELKAKSEAKTSEFNDQKLRYNKEEKRLKEEQQKLVDRRKALTSFSNYKLQQAAEREIEQASKQLSAQEESLIALLERVEDLEKESAELEEKLGGEEKELETLESDSKAELKTLQERAEEKTQERSVLAEDIDNVALQQYERIHERYPMDPVVALDKVTCSGCFMNVGPQMAVQIMRQEELIRCRGCGRILYIEEEKETEEE